MRGACVKGGWAVQVAGVCRGILGMLGSLTGEYAHLLTRLAVRQEAPGLGQELHLGQALGSLCIAVTLMMMYFYYLFIEIFINITFVNVVQT